MKFVGVSRMFSLQNEDQYNTIGLFWDEMSLLYGMENICGLGYKWQDGMIYYAIGLIDGNIANYNFEIELPDNGWIVVSGETDNLKDIYNEIYQDGPLKYEIETFTLNGKCIIKYYR